MGSQSLRLERIERALMPQRDGAQIGDLIARRCRDLLGDDLLGPSPDAAAFVESVRQALAAGRG